MTKKEILDLPIGKHLATDAVGEAYSIDVNSEDYVFVRFGAQTVCVSSKGSTSVIIGNVLLIGELTDRTFQSLTLLK